ncbi:hypothetical protein I317_00789 [Kwoniella heveanensis CBS 569]|nr:hypothetical protein I317_00789 [Kwoniella heveanensis CBS 569]
MSNPTIFLSPTTATPYSSSTSTKASAKMDPESLAVLIRQLKRSPESPSKLALPPIMAVIAEQDEDEEDGEEESDVSVSIEEVDDVLSSPSEYEGDDVEDASREGIFADIDIVRDDNVLWVIEEESEEAYDAHSSPEEAKTGSHVVDSLAPVDRYSPPPPSPSMHRLEPTFSSMTDDLYADQLSSHVSGCEEGSGLIRETESSSGPSVHAPPHEDHLEDPFRYTNADVESSAGAASTSDSCTQITEIPCIQRRRRTLSELEQYRKWALNKAAYLTVLEIEAEEERKRIKEQEEQMEREGLWITWSREKRGWVTGGVITRSKSYPPFSRPSTTFPTRTSDTLWSSPAMLPEEDESFPHTETIDPFLSTWYDEEDQIEHLEYASSSLTPNAHAISIYDSSPEVSSPPSEELLSPPSPKLDTPMQSKRNLFPSVDEALCQNGMLMAGVGLGLELSGMDSSSGLISDDEGYFNSQIGGEALRDALENGEGFVLREIPIKMIFPSRRDLYDTPAGHEPGVRLLPDGRSSSSQQNDVQLCPGSPEDLCRGRSRARSPIYSPVTTPTSTLGLATSPESQRYRSSRKNRGLQRSRSESIPSHRSVPDLTALNDVQDEAEVETALRKIEDNYLYTSDSGPTPFHSLDDGESRLSDGFGKTALAENEADMSSDISATQLNGRHSLSGKLPHKSQLVQQYKDTTESQDQSQPIDAIDCQYSNILLPTSADEQAPTCNRNRSRSRSAPPA